MTSMSRSLLAILMAGAAVLAGCEQETPIASRSPRADSPHDAVVGVWSNDSLCKGGLWLGYLPEGDVIHMLDPSKAPGELCENVNVIIAAQKTIGRWTSSGTVYKVVLSRDSNPIRTAFYTLVDGRLLEADENGQPRSGGEVWRRIMPDDPKTLDFIRGYAGAR